MKSLPKTIVRIHDGEEFVLNPDGKTYSMKLMLSYRAKGYRIVDWPYECLMVNYKGSFKIKE